MLQSIFDVENELCLSVEFPEWLRLDYNKKDATKKITSIIQNSILWKEGSEVLQVLEPLVCVL